MPIPYFKLHDRTAEDLVEELVARIPGHTPEWRNPREGDPGRTLIDLFAWLGDKLLHLHLIQQNALGTTHSAGSGGGVGT